MALSPQLQQFKSSGVYRLEFDKSQTVNIPSNTIRLVVGHSKKGPLNTPVLIENVEQFIQVFGSIDKNLERRGIFFHRSAIETLSRGPILCLNLSSIDYDVDGNEIDQASYAKLVTNALSGRESEIASTGYSRFFNTEKFWNPTDEKLLNVVGSAGTAQNWALNFVNIKQDPITVVARKAQDTRGFNLTAREWYGTGNVPEGIDEFDYVSDYMIDVWVFKGLFDPAELDNDPVFGDYFNTDGLLVEKVNEFAALREVTLLAQYTGSMIVDFMDNEGNILYIEPIINAESRRTGLFCAVNEDALQAGVVDLMANSTDPYSMIELLSHVVPQQAESENDTTLNKIISFNDVNEMVIRDFTNTGVVTTDEFLAADPDGQYAKIDSVSTDGTDVIITTSGPNINKSLYESLNALNSIFWTGSATATLNVAGTTITISGPDTFNAGGFTGSPAVDNHTLTINGENYDIVSYDFSGTDKTITVDAVINQADLDQHLAENGKLLYLKQRVATTNLRTFNVGPNARTVEVPTAGVVNGSSYTWTFESLGAGIIEFSTTVSNANASDVVFSSDIKVGMYFPAPGERLSRINQITRTETAVTGGTQVTYRFICHRYIENAPLFAYKNLNDSSSVYKMFPIPGASLQDKTIANLLAMLRPGTGLANALADKETITYRYLVDTFASLENNTLLNKEEFTLLAKERQNVSAILNAPMVYELRNSTNPSFTNEFTGDFSTNYIATGGNLNLNPTALYTLPSVNEGASYGFYYGPGLTLIENGKTKIVPPAAYVSNNFIDKYSNALPWSIVAGPRRGVVGGSGIQNVEYSFDKNDRDVLEPFGINPIVFERGVGLVVKGNKTAQQAVTSALSSAHVREVLIYIEDGLAEILRNYLFEFNTAQTRLEIKTIADSFMESVKKDQGIYDYRNIMDTSNNTTEVIDNNMGILDTFVEPVKGLEILVSRVTVLNTGEIASGNFS